MDSNGDDYMFYGTPIERAEEISSRKKKAVAESSGHLRSLPVWKQEMKKSNERFHGAFTERNWSVDHLGHLCSLIHLDLQLQDLLVNKLKRNNNRGVKLLLKMGWRHGHLIKNSNANSQYDAWSEARKAFLAFSSNDSKAQLAKSEPIKGNIESSTERLANDDVLSYKSTPVYMLSCWFRYCLYIGIMLYPHRKATDGVHFQLGWLGSGDYVFWVQLPAHYGYYGW